MATVRVGNYQCRLFKIEKRFKQASKLGPLLFIIFVNDLHKELESNLGTKVGNVFVSDQSFEGDTVLTANAPAKLKNLSIYL